MGYRKLAEKVVAVVASVLLPPATPRATNLTKADPVAPRGSHGGLLLLLMVSVAGLLVSVSLVVGFGLFGLLGLLLIAASFAAVGLWTRSENRRQRELATSQFESIVTAVRMHAPQFLIHWDGTGESVYQLNAWVPYLEKTNLPFAVIVRNPAGFDGAVKAVSNAPVVLAQSALEMERLLVPSATTVFYANNADCNNQILRFEHLKHIQLGHGDSEKSSSATRTFKLFDRVYQAGQAGIDRFAASGVHLDPSVFTLVGRPQVSGIEQAEHSVGEDETSVVLYAPTWWGDFADTSHSSLPFAEGLIELLLSSGCTVIFRPHPFTGRHRETAEAAERIRRLLREHAEATGRTHLFGGAAETELTLTECFNRSTAMISDVSAVSSDYLYSGKPLGLFVPTGSAGNVQADDGRYIFTEDPSGWPQQIEKLLSSDPLRSERLELRDHHLANARVQPPDRLFVDAARRDVQAR